MGLKRSYLNCSLQNSVCHFLLSLSIVLLVSPKAYAKIDLSAIERARNGTGDAGTSASHARNIAEAITFSLLQTESRVKLAGKWNAHFDAGYHVFDVNDKVIAAYTTTRSCPNTFQSIYGRVGVGLPIGFSFEGGFSQVTSDEKLTGAYGTLSFQAMDLAPWVYIDLVPAVGVSQTFLYNFSSPDLWAITSQANIGAYNRITGTQLGYIFQYTYSVIGKLNPIINQSFIRHGTFVQVPIYWGAFFRTQVYFPVLAGTVSLGYQF